MSYLPYISDEKLVEITTKVVVAVQNAEQTIDENLHKNTIDPFYALFEGAIYSMDFEEWIEREKIRKIQKTLQNAIGDFHEKILGNIPGWVSLGTGHIIDIKNENKKIIAEIKNRFNTTKGSQQVVIYDDLLKCLEFSEYHNFTAYSVGIIPKDDNTYNKIYDIPFTPPDNKTKQRRPINDKIRIISGPAFYDLATDTENSLSMLFEVLPKVISDITNLPELSTEQKALFKTLFERAF